MIISSIFRIETEFNWREDVNIRRLGFERIMK